MTARNGEKSASTLGLTRSSLEIDLRMIKTESDASKKPWITYVRGTAAYMSVGGSYVEPINARNAFTIFRSTFSNADNVVSWFAIGAKGTDCDKISEWAE